MNLGFAHIFHQLSAESETLLNNINGCVLGFYRKDAKCQDKFDDRRFQL